MYDSRTIRPRLPNRRGGGHGGESAATTNRWFKERGRRNEIRWGTHPRVIDARFGSQVAIAEGLAELAAEADEIAAEMADWAMDCESFDNWDNEDMAALDWVLSGPAADCGDAYCGICKPENDQDAWDALDGIDPLEAEVLEMPQSNYERALAEEARLEQAAANRFDQEVQDALAQLKTIDTNLAAAANGNDWYWARVYGQRYDRLCREIESEFGFDPRLTRV